MMLRLLSRLVLCLLATTVVHAQELSSLRALLPPEVAPELQAPLEQALSHPEGSADDADWIRAAYVLDANGFASAALAAYQVLQNKQPDQYLWPYHIAHLLEQFPTADEGAAVRVLGHYRLAHSLYAGDYAMLVHYGDRLLRSNALAQARKIYQQARGLDATRGFAELGLAQVAWLGGEVLLAQRWLEQAQRHSPNNGAIYPLQVTVLRELGDTQGVALAQRRALVFSKQQPWHSFAAQLDRHAYVVPRVVLALQDALSRGEQELAARLVERLPGVTDDLGEMRARLRYLRQNGRLDAAITTAEVLWQDRNDLQAAAWLLGLEGEHRRGPDWVAKLLSHPKFESSVDARLAYAQWLHRSDGGADSQERARQHALAVSQDAPHLIQAWLLLAALYEWQGRHDMAIGARQRYYEFDPVHRENTRALFSARLSDADYDGAWALLVNADPTWMPLEYLTLGALRMTHLNALEKQSIARRALALYRLRRHDPEVASVYALYLCSTSQSSAKSDVLKRLGAERFNPRQLNLLRHCEVTPIRAAAWYSLRE